MKVYITTEFDISTLAFRIKPADWDVCLVGETDKDTTKHMPGYSVDETGRDTWTVEISIDNGRIRNWPHGLDVEVNLFDPEGVYIIEDSDGNSITYIGKPPKCLRITDDTNVALRINENGYINDWRINLELLSEWGIVKS